MNTNRYLALVFPVFLAFHFTAAGQNIQIPDPKFRAALTGSLCVDTNGDGTVDADADTNNDNQIQISEALAVVSLKVPSSQIDSLNGVEQFANLQELSFSGNNVTSVNLLPLNNLKKLWCGVNKLVTLDLHGLNNLQYIGCSNNQLTSMNLQGVVNLEEIWAANNQLNSLNVTGLTALKILRLSTNQLSEINVQGLINLEYFDCSSNLITALNVQGLTSLKHLLCNYNHVTELNVQGLVQLINLYCGATDITALNLQNLPRLDQVVCRYSQLVDINIQGSHAITYLYLNNNFLTVLDLGEAHHLKDLNCSGNQLQYLNIKNGVEEIFGLSFGLNPDLQYICCDEDQLTEVRTKATQSGLTNCVIGSYCTFTPGGQFYRLTGQVKNDFNNNGCDNADAPYANMKFVIYHSTNGGTFISNNTGNYSLPLQAGTSSIHPVIENLNYFTVEPAMISLELPNDTNLLHQDICIVPNGEHHDVEITLIPIRPARPGFPATYRMVLYNKGNQVESGTVQLMYQEALMDFLSADWTPDAHTSGHLTWNFSNLLPFEKYSFDIIMDINKPTDLPPVNVGDLLSFNSSIEIPGNDEAPVDNFFGLRQEVIGAIDPNDKTCLEGDSITQHMVGDYLHYLIRFENTGTYAAENIVVKDLIDLAKFDISTLQIITSSHPCFTRISNGNVVEFIFENINLPFTDPDKYGFITFKIKTKTTLPVGSSVSNEADIFFDFNLPITTNKAVTVVYYTVGTQHPISASGYLQVQPNPVKDILYLNSGMTLVKAEVYDMLGRLTLQTAVTNQQLHLAGLSQGTYFIRFYGQEGIATARVVKE